MKRISLSSLLLILSACSNYSHFSGTLSSSGLNASASPTPLPTIAPIVQNGNAGTAPFTSTTISGDWTTGCENVNGYYYSQKVTFETSVVVIQTTTFTDAKCVNAVLKEEQIANYTLTADSSGSNYDLAETPRSVSYIALTSNEASALNKMNNNQGLCSFPNWVPNEEQAFTNMNDCNLNATFPYKASLFSGASPILQLDSCVSASEENFGQVRYQRN